MTFNIKKTPGHNGLDHMKVSGTGGSMRAKVASGSPPSIATAGLILHLDASNPTSYPGSGTTWYDLSANGNHAAMGVRTGGSNPTFTSDDGGGFTSFSTGYFDLSPNLRESYVSTGLSVFVWVKTQGNVSYHKIIERDDWGSPWGGWGLYYHYSNQAHGPHYVQSRSSTTLTNGNKYYIGFTISSGGTSKIYINGSLDGTDAGVTVPGAASYSPFIGQTTDGAGGSNPYSWNGNIYEVHMYDRDLSDAEVLSNYNITKTRFGL